MNALRPEHSEHLTRFRITSELIEAAGVRSVSDSEAREKLGINGYRDADLSGILFPYLSPVTGKRIGGRVRLDTPRPDAPKYIMEQGVRHLFFLPRAGELLRETSVPVIFVEAEKSSLAVTALAERAGRKMLAVASGGAWAWKRKIGKKTQPNGSPADETGPSPDLDLITWQDRIVIIAYDSNAATNPNVRKARRALAQELSARGASVLIAEVPAIEGVNGPDDLIAVSGDVAMLAILDAAKPFAGCALIEVEHSITELVDDKQIDPLPTLEAIAAIDDPARRALLIGRVAALKISGVNRKFIEEYVEQRRCEAAAEHEAAVEAARRGRLGAMKLDLAGLIVELEEFFSMRVWHPPHSSVHATIVEALFTVLTYCCEIFSGVPYLCLESAIPGCRKSTVLDLFSYVVFQVLYSAGLSRAVLVRQLDARRVTLLLDESEWLAGRSEAAETIRGVLHAGYRRGATYQVCEGDDHELREFRVFGPKVFSAINGLTGALLDRCIVLHMEKPPANVTLVSASADDVGPVALPLREKLEAFGIQAQERLEALVRERPSGGYWPEFRNREAEIWHPLLTIARACGPDIERRALEAARTLSKTKQSIQADERRVAQAIELVSVLDDMNCETFRPADLVEPLEAAEAWGEALSKKDGARLKASAIGRYLSSFRISSRDRKRTGSTYNRLETLEIVTRHIPPPDPGKSATGATGATGAANSMKILSSEVAPGIGRVPPNREGVSHGSGSVALGANGVPPEKAHKHGLRGTVAPFAHNPGGGVGVEVEKGSI
jgi:hypothetical protein